MVMCRGALLAFDRLSQTINIHFIKIISSSPGKGDLSSANNGELYTVYVVKRRYNKSLGGLVLKLDIKQMDLQTLKTFYWVVRFHKLQIWRA